MIKKKKKGFTLIELIAVIIILAMIALIAVPVVNSSIEASKKKTFGITCDNISRALENYRDYQTVLGTENVCSTFEFNSTRNEAETINGVRYEPLTKLELKGKLPVSGTAKVCDGKVDIFADNNEYTCVINENRNDVIKGNIIDNDITAPLLSGISLTSNTNSIFVVVNASEPDGAITKYYYSLDGKNFEESNSSNYTYKNLENNKDYTVTVKIENKSGLQSGTIQKTITTKDIINPSIVQTSQIPTSGYAYATERIIKITYTNTGIDKPIYYFKSSVDASVASGIVIEDCGTKTNPSTCTANSVTTLLANTWYKTNNLTPSITYKNNGILYAALGDGINISGTSTYSISKIDRIAPTIAANIDGKNVDLQLDDNEGVIGYAVTTTDATPTSWNEITSTSSISKPYIGSTAGTYYAHVIDVAGNTAKVSFELAQTAFSYAATDSSYTAIGINADYTATPVNANYTATGTNANYTSSTGSSSYGASCERHCNCPHAQGSGSGHCNYDVSVGLSVSWFCVYSCPSGGSLSGSSCVTTYRTCPNGGTLSGTTCIKTNYTCPNGGSLSGTTCLKTNYSCPSGGSLSGTTCLKTDYTCPNGGTLNGTTCTLYTCPNGGTLDGTTCKFN